jgi:catechol 2,3-dioxygenase-like lactoylglutathione lyase family enzyme
MRELVEVALFSDDVDAARAFYSELVGATPVADWPGGAIFATGGAKILVHERAAATDGGPPNEDHFALSVEDLDETCAALVAAGNAFLLEPHDYLWGRSAYLRDPDGRLVELAQA